MKHEFKSTDKIWATQTLAAAWNVAGKDWGPRQHCHLQSNMQSHQVVHVKTWEAMGSCCVCVASFQTVCGLQHAQARKAALHGAHEAGATLHAAARQSCTSHAAPPAATGYGDLPPELLDHILPHVQAAHYHLPQTVCKAWAGVLKQTETTQHGCCKGQLETTSRGRSVLRTTVLPGNEPWRS